MNFDDLDNTYHIEKFKNKKKKVDGGKKGKRVEREIVGILNERFSHLENKTFSRSVGSGNRWGQVKNLPSHAKETLTGDLCCPEGFKFVIESKGGYNKIDLNSIFETGNTELDNFLQQVTDDSKRCGKIPLLVWKRDRRPWLAFMRTEDITGDYAYKITYREWTCVPIKELLKLADDFFFS
jgi:hypothetical protein